MYLSLNVALLSIIKGFFELLNSLIRVIEIRLIYTDGNAISVNTIADQVLFRGVLPASRDATCDVEIYHVAWSIRECHIEVHSHKLPLMRVLGDKCVFLDVWLQEFIYLIES